MKMLDNPSGRVMVADRLPPQFTGKKRPASAAAKRAMAEKPTQEQLRRIEKLRADGVII
jgi:hypothetical protein